MLGLCLALAGLAATACGTGDFAGLGEPCTSDRGCESNFCSGSVAFGQEKVCAAATADLDGDGLGERDERRAGTNPMAADTDGDGLADALEVGPDPGQPIDADGDGKPDALEATGADLDQDCLPDPVDGDDVLAASPAVLGAFACQRGVCAGHAATGTCDPATGQVTCSVAGVPGFEAGTELSCDLLDNDCDGLTDEDLAGKAGAVCGSHGVCASGSASTCVQGKWQCNLALLTGYETVEKTCDGLDNDCDGQIDEAGLCADGLPCTIDTCVPGNSGSPGTGPAGGCVHTPDPKLCNDGNPCTTEVCEIAGGCKSIAKVGGCDDGEVCTQGESCVDGVCKGGQAVLCDDGNQCTLDHCDVVLGCVQVPMTAGAACKPDDACMQAGACGAGVCNPTTPVDCNDGNPCTQDQCNAATGTCAHEPLTGPCNDGIPCTEGDVCSNGVCVGKPLATCCSQHADCADNSACTVDTCQDGQCGNDILAANGVACDDGNPCTKGETCAFGACAAKQLDKCADDNACTLDICDPVQGCLHTVLPDGASCDDGDVCNGTDVCVLGACKVGKKPECVDANPCTLDTCDPLKGCQFKPHTGDCSDLNACTTKDSCSSGSCVGAALVCNDNNPCTADGCDTTKGCAYVPLAAVCSDGDACTAGDACAAGKCTGAQVVCNDDNPCTIDTCAAAAGCKHDSAATEGTGCADGSACTLGDACAGGVCTSGTTITCDDKNPCTDDKCDAVSGLCKYAFNTAACTDGTACTADPKCKNGVCKGTQIAGCCKANSDCFDTNPCTIDACDAGTCQHTLVDNLGCEDGSKCTVGDSCAKGACVGGAKLGCDDGKPCTADYCLAASGCAHLVLVSGPCSDGQPCNGLEQCTPAGCQPAAPLACDDGNPCTLDGCDATGCTHAFVAPGTGCSDGAACTGGDACDGKGACKGTLAPGPGCCATAADCDDGFACTLDDCHEPTSTCTFSALTCGNGNPCNVGFCAVGACTTADTCSKPAVFAESFEAGAPGWTLAADAGTAGWTAGADAQAADGSQSLHVGYATGSWTASLPELGLQAGKYVLRVHARLDVDGDTCGLGALQAQLGGQPLGDALCQSGALTLIERPFSVGVGSKPVRLGFAFLASAKTPDPKRGAWLDAVQVVALPPDDGCACLP